LDFIQKGVFYMQIGEVSDNMKKLVSDVISCIENQDFDGMKAGILVAERFLDSRLSDNSFRPRDYCEFGEALRDAVYNALSFE
jgi:hypothetical protein